ncbi:zinc-ribbon domain-containing protein [Chloroflexota bacterium]
MFCTKCGAQNNDTAEFCTSCGNPLKGGSPARAVGAATGLQRRDPIMVLIFWFITFGIYGYYWYVMTKLEMNASGTKIPTAWLIIIPIINFWWMWKFSEGIEQVTQGRMTGPIAFLLLFFLGLIGGAIIQDTLNKFTAD